MTIPNYLNVAPKYRNDPAVVDVQTIIDNVTALALAATPAWSSGGAGLLTSPADASGRSMSLAMTRISATTIQVAATDGQGRSYTRRASIAAGGSSVDYYIGQFWFIVDWLNAGTPEGIHVYILDETPEVQTSHNKWMHVIGSRDTAGTFTNQYFVTYGALVDSTGVFVYKTRNWLHVQGTARNSTSNGYAATRTQGGANVLYPAIIMGDSVVSTYKIRGKVYGTLLGGLAQFADGTEVSVPLDESQTGIFKTTHLNHESILSDFTKQLVRKS